MRNWIRAQLAGKMGKDYSFDVGDDRGELDPRADSIRFL